MSAKCIIPKHAEVANAVGAVIADITAKAKVEITPETLPDGSVLYTVYTKNEQLRCEGLEQAQKEAEEYAKRQAEEEARLRGALGKLQFKTNVTPKVGYSSHGDAIDLGTTVEAIATGRIGLKD